MANLTLSASPHIRDRATTQSIMRDVLIALVPTLIAACVIFGIRSLLVTAVCIVSSILCEAIYEKLMHKAITVSDGSAAVTGMLIAFNVPVTIPLWQCVFGSFVAIIVVKQLFGGLGKNFANPAITARIVMFLSFSTAMTNWKYPGVVVSSATGDAVSMATPLGYMASDRMSEMPAISDMLLGYHGGCLGETCVLTLLVGFVYLLIRRVITWHLPVVYVATVFVLSYAFGADGVYHILSGGLMLGAVFMATDYVTSPVTAWGKVIFGVGAGFITVLIRLFGSYNEGVSFAILLMNILTPYINKAAMPRVFGGAVK